MAIYLDHNATTPPAPAVIDAMVRCMTETWANASSTHAPGQAAKRVLRAARESVARLVGCEPSEIVFTSGATEANAMVLHGVAALAGRHRERSRLVTTPLEHAALLKLARQLPLQGAVSGVDLIAARVDGTLDLAMADALIGADTALVSVMAANNETGVLMPIHLIAALAHARGALAHARGALLHVDATQVIGKLPFDFSASGADLMSVSAHKLHGPKGVGALVIRKGLAWPALLAGAQERGRRGGTENLPAIAGFAAAADAIVRGEPLAARAARVAQLRDRLEAGLRTALPVHVYGSGAARLPNTSFVRFGSLHAEQVLQRLERFGVVASAGAACEAGGSEPSHVLTAMGVARDEAFGAVRLSLGATTSEAEIDVVLDRLPAALAPLLQATPHALTA